MLIKVYQHPLKSYIVLPREWDIACWNPLPGGGVEHIDSWPAVRSPGLYRSPYLCDVRDRPVDSWDYLPEFFDAFPQEHKLILTYNPKEPLVGPVCFLAGEEDYLRGVFALVERDGILWHAEEDSLVAQWTEQPPPKGQGEGSNPSEGTRTKREIFYGAKKKI